MKPIELLYFEDINPFHESVFGFPIIGKLSMRQMLIIGVSAIVSWFVYQNSGTIIAMLPLSVGIFVGLKKFNVKPFESLLISIIKFIIFEKKNKSDKLKKKFGNAFENQQSRMLGLPKLFQPELLSVNSGVQIREILTDPLKPLRLQIKLETPERRPISNTKTKVELDGNIISTLTTNHNGEIEVIIVPRTAGEKRLLIFADGSVEPVFEEMLLIKSS